MHIFLRIILSSKKEGEKADDIAKKHGVTLCMECHRNTFTESAEDAVWLMRTVGSPNFRMYWQPFQWQSAEENVENAKKIAQSGAELIIRTPVVPGFNDTAKEIKAISAFAASLPGVEEHHLLPYHRLGQDKYAGLGRNYALKEILPPSNEKMEYLLSVAQESGLKCQIGG